MTLDDKRFYGYKHWTLEKIPRCFYVGKGLIRRPYDGRRSKKWHAVVKAFGLRVEICIGPVTNKEAIDWEILTIKTTGTYSKNYIYRGNDVSCNFTQGGDGASGRQLSSDARLKIGDAQRGKEKSSETRLKISESLKGRKLSLEVRQKMSLIRKNKQLSKTHKENLWIRRSRTFSEQHRKKLSEAAKKRKVSQETCARRSLSLKGKFHHCSLCGLIGHNRLSCDFKVEYEKI